jgi:two-component system sensor histidine kinase CpxA
MHRLFWKIFLSFWLTLVVFAVLVIFAASSYLEHTRTQQDKSSIRTRLSEYFDQGQAIAKQKGMPGLAEWLDHLDRSEAIPILLINEAGNDLLGREVPAYIISRLDRRREQAEQVEQKRRPRYQQLIQLADGSTFRHVPDFQSITLRRVLQRPKVIALPVAIAALMSALACLILSRYLTFPLERLRHATQLVAAGDLTQRVVPSMSGRRDEIAELASAFDKMAERLDKVFSAQRQLLSDVSHELRSPLARLQVALGLARQRSNGQAEKELDRIELEIERLDQLIARLLEFSRLEAGVDAAKVEQVDIGELLEGLVEDAQLEADAKDCKVRLEASFPAIVNAHPALLYSAVENVVRNAIKYTKRGTAVEISMLAAKGKGEGANAENIIIEVRDHGPGVPEETLPHLFEPFTRAEKARDRPSGGYGLGLAIADRAIRLHNGNITARNHPEGGLVVCISLARLNQEK